MANLTAPGGSRAVFACLGVCLAVAGVWAPFPARAAEAPAADTGVPVTVQAAAAHDVPVYASGLGTVTALNSVLIRPRVDGTLVSVNFTEGQTVHKGDLLAVIDPRPYKAVLDQAIAKRDQDAATLANANRDLARYSTLAKSGYATSQQADSQSASVAEGKALIAADAASIEAAALNLSFTHITSPIDGRAGLRQINPGNLVHATDTQGIVVITQLHPIGVLFTLPEDQVAAVADAQRGGQQPVVEAFDSEQHHLLASGTLLTEDNTISAQTGTITLKAEFANAQNHLWPGAFVQARIRLRMLHEVVTVPASAVQRGQDGLYVFVVGPGDKARLQPVTEYQEQDEVAAIKSGLAAGTQVVVAGQSRVSDGIKLTIDQASG
jgi:multidrug efflux system membrane fusion protein